MQILSKLQRTDIIRILVVAAATAIVASGVIRNRESAAAVAIAAAVVGGYGIAREAIEALLHRKMTMELSMCVAIAAAFSIGEMATALLILLFVLAAEVLEDLTLDRGRRALGELVEMLPSSAWRIDGDDTVEIAVKAVRVGDTLLIKPGTRIPADGVVLRGHSSVDQSTVTGESMPVEKAPGAAVSAGTLNQSGSLDMRVSAVGRDTTFGKIVTAIETSERSRAPVERLADRLAAFIVVIALGSALLTFAVTRDARAAIAVVIVAGACGVAAGTPLAILAGIGQAARKNIIIKGGAFLERLSVADVVVFDKTGTLTLGEAHVSALLPAAGESSSDLLYWAATAEQHSEHPLAAAILSAASRESIRLGGIASFDAVPGRGVLCRTTNGAEVAVGNAALMKDINAQRFSDDRSPGVKISVNGRFIGTIEIADPPRVRSAAAVAALRSLGLRTCLLTGDDVRTARLIGERLGVDEIDAALLPEQKEQRVRQLREAGHVVAMVGDGINDAPALVAADIGMAMGSGTDVTREAADVVLIGDDPMRVVDSIVIARRCRRVIMQNFVGTIVVDAAGILLAGAGFLPPVAAAIVHVSSVLAFIVNSARLLPAFTPRRPDADSLQRNDGVAPAPAFAPPR